MKAIQHYETQEFVLQNVRTIGLRVLPKDVLNIVIDYVNFETKDINCRHCDKKLTSNKKMQKIYLGRPYESIESYLCTVCYTAHRRFEEKVFTLRNYYFMLKQDIEKHWSILRKDEMEKYIKFLKLEMPL